MNRYQCKFHVDITFLPHNPQSFNCVQKDAFVVCYMYQDVFVFERVVLKKYIDVFLTFQLDEPQKELADVPNFPNVRVMTVGRFASPGPINDLRARAVWGPTTAGIQCGNYVYDSNIFEETNY